MSRIFEVVRAMSGQNNSISFPRPYLEFFSNDQQAYQLAAVLNQLVFWSGRSSLEADGWFYKTYEELGQEVSLSPDQVRRVVDKLVKVYLPGVIKTANMRVNGDKIKHYWLDGDLLVSLIFPPIQDMLRSGESAKPETRICQTDPATSPLPSGEVATPIPYTDLNIHILKPICEAPDPEVLITDQAKDVLKYLNEKLGSRYQPCTASLENIRARLRDGHEQADLELVVDYLIEEWLNDEKMAKYLRPSTLFQPSKFDGYLLSSKSWLKAGRPKTQRQVQAVVDTVLRDIVFRKLFSGSYKPQSDVEKLACKLAQSANLGRMTEFNSRQAWNRIWNEASRQVAEEAGHVD